MTTENRPWLTVGATVAVISTGRSTGMKQISMDTVDSIGDKLITTLGHQFDLNTLEATAGLHDMYLWRIDNPESPQVKLDLAVQAREKALAVLRRDQDRFDREPTSLSAVSLLIQGLNRYRDAIIEADKAAEALQDAA